MFCPKCATNNVDGASFCRGCGSNISLVSQALTGQAVQQPVEEVDDRRRHRRRGRELTLDHAFKNIFMGVAFLIVAIVLSRTIGRGWWFWMLLPAFSMMGTGLAQFIRLRERDKQASLPTSPQPQSLQDRSRNSLPDRGNPDVLMPPAPSVTEGTTRHLNVKERQ